MDRKFLGGWGAQDEKSWKFQGYGEYHESPEIENPRECSVEQGEATQRFNNRI